MSGLGTELTESMLQSIISESSRTLQCWGALGSSEKDLLLPSWATATLLILGKVLQCLALLATDKSPWFRFVLPSPCPVSAVRGQFKEPPAPALVSSLEAFSLECSAPMKDGHPLSPFTLGCCCLEKRKVMGSVDDVLLYCVLSAP